MCLLIGRVKEANANRLVESMNPKFFMCGRTGSDDTMTW